MLVGRQTTFRHARGKADNIPTCSWEGRQHSDMHLGKQTTFRHARGHSDMLVGRQTTFRHARGKADNIPTCSWEGRKHSDMLVGRQTTFRHARGKADNILLPHMQKHAKLWLMTQKYSKVFVFVLIRNFNSFCSSFYHCKWPENFHHHAYSRHHAN